MVQALVRLQVLPGTVTNTFALGSPSSTAPSTARAGSAVELATSGERTFHLQQLLAGRCRGAGAERWRWR